MTPAVVGICMVKDEADVIVHTLRHMAEEGLDAIFVIDNGSRDGTRQALTHTVAVYADTWQIPAELFQLEVTDDPDPAYYQSAKMSALADRVGQEFGIGTWIVPFDADELWLARDRVAMVLQGLPRTTRVARASLFNHFCTLLDREDSNPFLAMRWRQAVRAGLPKVAFRWEPGAVIHQGNHGVTLPTQLVPDSADTLEIRHFPYRSANQMVRKARNGAAAYRATSLPESEGAHWRAYGRIIDEHGEEALREVFREHFWYRSPTDSGMVLDPAPWCRWSRS